MGNAIEVADVSKRFRISTDRQSSIKERVIQHRKRAKPEDFWALRDITFDVEEGHTTGLLGHNGSGKSTLLKCTGGILQPTKGEIRTRGRLASLLELGAGFHPDLTGRENVYLNGSILGLSKADIAKRFDDIVGFAEMERFIDQQVKHYSSGMYVRLGFSVATNVEPDVLLVDEVLAVGDESFQRKCLDRIKAFQRDGRTIVFVTHGADLVRQICDRAVVLDHGEMVVHGTPSEAVRAFREQMVAGGLGEPTSEEAAPEHDLRVRIRNVTVDYPVAERPYAHTGESVTVRVAYEATDPVADAVFVVSVHTHDGHLLYGDNTWVEGHRLPALHGMGEIAFVFDALPLLEGHYPVTVGVHSLRGGQMFDWREQEAHVDVVNPSEAWGSVALPTRVDLERLAAEAGSRPSAREGATGDVPARSAAS
ncbi:MAG TPA: ABC transporter ATP-binding protein [Acidimicrobiales bacterium]|nr:ABC transporter ATP-binding protein [Acidimicrobiales bacterium]